jgi:hypothetical protein
VYTLFSGYDDEEAEIYNYWEGSLNDLGLSRLKRMKRIVVQGEIGPEQTIKVSFAIDRGEFAEIGTISGSDSQVDTAQQVNVGNLTIGVGTVGGGGSGITAYNYMKEFVVNADMFHLIKLRFEATRLGYASVSMIEMKDIREKWAKVPVKYR